MIGETIKSVVAQTFQDFEYIIIDDNSEDNTYEVVNSFNDNRIKYFKYQDIDKISRLRNLGLNQAKGEFIAFIDSDDSWDQNKLQFQVEKLKLYPDAGFSFHSISLINSSGVIKNDLYHDKSGIFTGNIFKKIINNEIVVYPSTLLFRKTCLTKVNMIDENLDEGEHDFIAKLCYHFGVCIIYKSLCKIRKHNQNLNPKNHLRIRPYEEYIKTLNFFNNREQIPKRIYKRMLGFNNYMIGNSLLSENYYDKAKKYYSLSFKQNPVSIQGVKAIIKCFLSTYNKK
jgi:glycosyltransferase involved in cell wall biosynthesis